MTSQKKVISKKDLPKKHRAASKTYYGLAAFVALVITTAVKPGYEEWYKQRSLEQKNAVVNVVVLKLFDFFDLNTPSGQVASSVAGGLVVWGRETATHAFGKKKSNDS